MIPDASTWRSSAQYKHLDALTASDLAWDWLRRNHAYDTDFETAVADGGDPEPLTRLASAAHGIVAAPTQDRRARLEASGVIAGYTVVEGMPSAIVQTAHLFVRYTVDPQAWFTDTFPRIPDYKITKVDDLLPWRWNE